MKKLSKKHHIDRRLTTSRTIGRWRMSHLSHTGRSLPHSHTSYPVLAMIVLCVGVLMAGIGHTAGAATFNESRDIEVTAQLYGLAPTQAATITSPSDGTAFAEKPITVMGTCPNDTYVVLVRNGVDSGMAICQADNTYSLQTDLFNGNNALQAQVYNTTNVAGPISETVTVSYNLPLAVQPDGQPASQPSTSGRVANQPSPMVAARPPRTNPTQAPVDPLLITTKFQYLGHLSGQPIDYSFEVSGGLGPYAILLDWGDGSQKLLTLPAAGLFTATHTYQTAGGYKGSYPIIVTVTDAAGTETSLQIATIIKDQLGAGGGSISNGTGVDLLPGNGSGSSAYIWTTYGVVVLMVMSFWLGELRELRHLRPRLKRIRHA